jgi:hypothetical protein
MPTMKLNDVCDFSYAQYIDDHRVVEPEDKPALRQFFLAMKVNNGKTPMEYIKKQYNGSYWGRYYPQGYKKPITYQWASIRSLICGSSQVDIDIKKCHPTIIENIGRKYGFKTDCLTGLKNDFNAWVDKLHITDEQVALYNKKHRSKVDRSKIAKGVYTMLLYGAGTPKINSTNGFSIDPNFYQEYKREVKEIASNVLRVSKYNKMAEDYRIEKAKEGKKKSDQACLSIVCQEIESRYVSKAIEIFQREGLVPTTYIYDGFQCMASDDIDRVLAIVNAEMPVIFIVKPWEEPLSDTMDIEEFDSATDPMDFLDILKKGENDVARYAKRLLRDKLVFCEEQWFLYDKVDHKWRNTKTPSALIVSTIQDDIDHTRMRLLAQKTASSDADYKEKCMKADLEFIKIYPSVARPGFSSQVEKYLREYLLDNTFSSTLDVMPYCVAYRNGILYLETMEFRKGLLPEDKLTQYIPYDYEVGKKADIAFVREQLKKINNYKDSHLNYYLSFLGYTMCGVPSLEQAFWNLLGQKASNGKSVVFEALMSVLPNYVMSVENDLFEKTYGSRHKEVSTWRGIRLLWLNELTKKKQDEAFIKLISDGTSTKYKVMYGATATMPITFNMAIISNNSLNISACAGLARRLRTLQMDSDFVEDLDADDYDNCRFRKDKNFANDLKGKYKYALMSLIYEYSHKFCTEGKMEEYPKEWVEATETQVAGNNSFNDFWVEHFEEDDSGEKISKKEVAEIIESFRPKISKIDDELKRMRIPHVYSPDRIYYKGVQSRGYYTGFKKVAQPDPVCLV